MEGDQGRVVLVHLQLQVDGSGDLGRVGHAPIEASALAGCTSAAPRGMTFDAAAFEDGYRAWRDAVRAGEAGAFTLGPADAYWATIGIRDGAMNS